MFDAIKPLVDNGIINEETKLAISEAWESKLNEAREQIRAEMREEFAGRYEHDKSVMVEALDKMVTESLQAEILEFNEEKQQLAADRVRFNNRMQESVGKFDQFLVAKLAEEIKELRSDRRVQKESVQRLEKFVVKSLAEEIQEFSKDKQEVVETKVRLVSEAKQKLASLQENFVKRSAALVKESVAKGLESEMTQLKEDIQIARENNFGRRLFEAFASEFAITHLNENQQIAKLNKALEEKEAVIAEAKQAADEKSALVESKDREIKIIKESQERKTTMNELLKPLNKEKQDVMVQLLENVQTEKLKSAFEKYLPAVLNNSATPKAEKPAMLSESRVEVTGDKTAKASAEPDYNNVVEIKRLAGLK
jgi:predicted DNA-binding protein